MGSSLDKIKKLGKKRNINHETSQESRTEARTGRTEVQRRRAATSSSRGGNLQARSCVGINSRGFGGGAAVLRLRLDGEALGLVVCRRGARRRGAFPRGSAVRGGDALGDGGARRKKKLNAGRGDLPRGHLFMVEGKRQLWDRVCPRSPRHRGNNRHTGIHTIDRGRLP